MSAEEYNRLLAGEHLKSNNTSNKSSMPSGFKGNKGFEIVDNYNEVTDEESSPL
jgi:hypothetical protein